MTPTPKEPSEEAKAEAGKLLNEMSTLNIEKAEHHLALALDAHRDLNAMLVVERDEFKKERDAHREQLSELKRMRNGHVALLNRIAEALGADKETTHAEQLPEIIDAHRERLKEAEKYLPLGPGDVLKKGDEIAYAPSSPAFLPVGCGLFRHNVRDHLHCQFRRPILTHQKGPSHSATCALGVEIQKPYRGVYAECDCGADQKGPSK